MSRRLTSDGRARWAVMKKFVIPDWDDPSMPYLVRWRVVQTPWFAVYLHQIILDDLGRPLHDHPWAFLSLILKGWYREEFLSEAAAEPAYREWGRWSIHRMGLESFHGITQVGANTWTLVLTGPRRQVWGFLTDEGWKPWNEVSVREGLPERLGPTPEPEPEPEPHRVVDLMAALEASLAAVKADQPTTGAP